MARQLRDLIAAVLWLCIMTTTTVEGQEVGKRVALVIGNGAYEDLASALPNPPNDARDMATKLQELGFVVVSAIDQDYRGMRSAMREFDRALQGADAGLFYYAGHGMEYRGRNYLFPTDAVLETEGDIGIGLIDVAQVMQVLETTVPTRLLFLDACRNNPLARQFRGSLGASRSSVVGTGLARMDAAVGTFIAYATAPGDVAADGDGDNSPFTSAMLAHLDEPGLEVGQLMRKVRDSVLVATNERQVPWDSSSLRGAPFVLNLNITVQQAPAPMTAQPPDQQAEIVFWQSIENSNQASAFQAYLERFGEDGLFAPLAQLRLEAISSEAEMVATLRVPEESALPAIETTLDPLELERELGLSRADWRQLQTALAAIGFDPRGIDGSPGANTRRAIQAWQEANSMPPSGAFMVGEPERLLAQAEPKLAALEATGALANLGTASVGRRFRDCDACPEMVILPAGRFAFGSPSGERGRTSDEGPQQPMTIERDFAIGRFEVTERQWRACTQAGRCRSVGLTSDTSPVRNLGWSDAKTYIDWLGQTTGKNYLLPDEIVWEYAARGGNVSAYPWGSDIGRGRAVCDGCGTAYDLDRPAPVGSYAANGFGLYDMVGNVAEWTAECYTGSGPREAGLRAASNCTRYVIKGGSYASRPHRLRSAAREGDFGDPAPERGFRVMRWLD